jgi:hypothetical protein
MVLMMVYSTQNHWVFCILSIIQYLNTKKQNISEAGSVSTFRCGEEDTYSVVSLRKIILRAETDPDSETLCFLVFGIPHDGQV